MWITGWRGTWAGYGYGSGRARAQSAVICRSCARPRGAMLPARTLSRVEDFAATIWLWASVTPMLCFLVGAVAAKALSGGAIPFAIAAGFGSPLLLLFGIAGAQIATAQYRALHVRLYLK